jgi:hypothetical protein
MGAPAAVYVDETAWPKKGSTRPVMAEIGPTSLEVAASAGNGSRAGRSPAQSVQTWGVGSLAAVMPRIVISTDRIGRRDDSDLGG